MKILFVASGNNKNFGMAPFIREQAEALLRKGIQIDFYLIKGKGIRGYLGNVPNLRKKIKEGGYDLVHTHYALCAILAVMASPSSKLVISLMGTDVNGMLNSRGRTTFRSRYLMVMSYMARYFADAVIIKSENLSVKTVFKRRTYLIPNGIDVDKFCRRDDKFRDELGYKTDERLILFLGSRESTNKNFHLLEDAAKRLPGYPGEVRVVAPYPIPHTDTVKYYNACDIFVMCSYKEGSPNVVKEAMACEIPIVATDVGDVRKLFINMDGAYIAELNPESMKQSLLKALEFKKSKRYTNGRHVLKVLGLESGQVADALIRVYHDVISG